MKPYNLTTFLAGLMTVVLCFTAVPGLAGADGSNTKQGYYFIGLGYGYHDIDMNTDFTRQINGVVTEISGFENNYTSNSGSIFTGYVFPRDKFYLSCQASLGIYDDEFELSVGSSHITNVLNHNIGIDVMPGVYLTDGLSVFAMLGLDYGDFDFVKSSPTSTTYDEGEALFGYTVGVGLAYDLNPRVTLKAGFEKTWYEDTAIHASLGVLSDRTVVEPEMETFFFTIQYAFPR